jgi:hypothetical protein
MKVWANTKNTLQKNRLHKWDEEIKKNNIEQNTAIQQMVKHTKIRRLDRI